MLMVAEKTGVAFILVNRIYSEEHEVSEKASDVWWQSILQTWKKSTTISKRP